MRERNTVKITIITPLYNSERFIERLRDSIISQGHLDLIEWILIDDASSKESVEKVSSLLKNQLISTSLYQLPVNSGGGVPTAFGISKAKGELLIKIDHDDELVPNAISTILGDYDDLEGKHDICGMLYRSIDPNTNKVLKSGSAIPKGKLFSFSDKNNVFKDHSDTFEVYITDVIRQFWTPEYMNKATLSTPVLFKMSRFKPFVSMGDIGLLKYHRDNPNSQTNHIRVSKNTVHTYSEVFNQFDYKYLLRPIFYLKTAVMLLVFSKMVFNDHISGIRYVDSFIFKFFFFILIPVAIIKMNFSSFDDITIVDRVDYPLLELGKTKKLI